MSIFRSLCFNLEMEMGIYVKHVKTHDLCTEAINTWSGAQLHLCHYLRSSATISIWILRKIRRRKKQQQITPMIAQWNVEKLPGNVLFLQNVWRIDGVYMYIYILDWSQKYSFITQSCSVYLSLTQRAHTNNKHFIWKTENVRKFVNTTNMCSLFRNTFCAPNK